MTVLQAWVICLTLWNTNAPLPRAMGNDYATEAACLEARSTMRIDNGALTCVAVPVAGV